jgi:hypothetical protein
MFDSFGVYPWFLPTVYYEKPDQLPVTLKEQVIEPVESKAQELARRLDEIRRSP